MRFKKINSLEPKNSLFLSLIIHILPMFIMLFFMGPSSGNGIIDRETNNDNSQDKIVEKPTEITTVDVIKTKGKDKSKVKHGANTECKKSFGGIGIVSNGTKAIVEVIKGYPAYEAGIKVGDILITSMDDIRGDIGTQIEVQYLSAEDGSIHSVVLTREKICVDKAR